MKRTALIVCLGFFSFLSIAQPRPFPPEKLSDEEIIRMQTKDIVSWLDLEGKTKERFVTEYTAFRKEIDAISKNARPPKDIKDESEIDKAIQQNFAVSEQILRIREKYYLRFKEFMKPSQIQMMYRIEHEAGRRMHDGPGGPGEPGRPGHPGKHDGPGEPGRHGEPGNGCPVPPPHGGDRPEF